MQGLLEIRLEQKFSERKKSEKLDKSPLSLRHVHPLLSLRHVHPLLGRLIALCDRTRGRSGLDFFLLLDESTARAPVGRATVARSVAPDAIPLSDLASLHQGIAVRRNWLTKTLPTPR
jgi:hypothetical protein